MVKDKSDITIKTYNNIVQEYISYFKTKQLDGKVQFQREINYLVKHLSNNSTILDVGTATGDYPKYLTEQCKKNFKVTGIDAAPNMIREAKKKSPKANFAIMDMRNIKYDKNSFDAIICFATLIHVNDNDCIKILNKFNSLLKDSGIIIINVLEHKNNKKEIFESEPFNPKYKTFFNRYKKNFFTEYFTKKRYQILKFYNNPIFNKAAMKTKVTNDNQFSIIVKKFTTQK